MDHFAGLDVSVKETSVCIVNDTGRIVREVKLAGGPEALLPLRKTPATPFDELDWKPGRCRNGCSALWPKPSYQWSVSRRGTCRRCRSARDRRTPVHDVDAHSSRLTVAPCGNGCRTKFRRHLHDAS